MMEREKFMQDARLTAHKILEGKENGIMNLVQQAWAEGKRNAEVEALKEAVLQAFEPRLKVDADELKEPKLEYPAWGDWLRDLYGNPNMSMNDILESPIHPEIADRLYIVPKKVKQ